MESPGSLANYRAPDRGMKSSGHRRVSEGQRSLENLRPLPVTLFAFFASLSDHFGRWKLFWEKLISFSTATSSGVRRYFHFHARTLFDHFTPSLDLSQQALIIFPSNHLSAQRPFIEEANPASAWFDSDISRSLRALAASVPDRIKGGDGKSSGSEPTKTSDASVNYHDQVVQEYKALIRQQDEELQKMASALQAAKVCFGVEFSNQPKVR